MLLNHVLHGTLGWVRLVIREAAELVAEPPGGNHGIGAARDVAEPRQFILSCRGDNATAPSASTPLAQLARLARLAASAISRQ